MKSIGISGITFSKEKSTEVKTGSDSWRGKGTEGA